MDNTELHYLTYDEAALWDSMIEAYIEAGGDVLYPGDEKEMLLRGVQNIIMIAFAGIDNALRMDTLRYAVRDYLDVYGEKRNCYRIEAQAATAGIRVTFKATGESKTIPAGTLLTADGVVLYELAEDITQTGYAEVIETTVICNQSGSVGNGLLAGTEMQWLEPQDGSLNVTVITDAAGGQNREDDETYRERIRTFGLIAVTTGPSEQYESAAKDVSSEIIDAKAINGGGGIVNVYLILASETGSAAIIAAVEKALSPEDIRPLTDKVNVSLATKRPYKLNVRYSSNTGANTKNAISEAVSEYKTWQETTIGQSFNPDKLIALLYQAGCKRVFFDEGSEFDGGEAVYTEIADNEYCSGEITLAVISG